MGSSSGQPKVNKVFDGAAAGGFIFRESFQMLTTTLLSLLLPLSFLILARLAIARANYLLLADVSLYPNSLLVDLFLNTNSTLLHALVPLVAVAALTHSLNARLTFVKSQPAEPVSGPRLYSSWILLCTLQVCVGLGIEGSIAARVGGSVVDVQRQKSLLSRALFFLGLHETMLFWSKTVVKPVVDDTIFGFSRQDRWVDKAAMALSFGGLWWWKLREEVEALVVVAEVKRDLSMGVGLTDFVGWWLYYLTITIGMVKVVKTVIRLPLIFIFRRVHGDANTVSLHNWRINDTV